MAYVQRDESGAVKGVYAVRQPGYADEWLDESSAEIAAYRSRVDEIINPPRAVPKSVIINRLTEEQVAAAIGAMTFKQQERWRSPDSPAVRADDEEVRGLLKAIGADPDVILG
jgi:hypothetical protein